MIPIRLTMQGIYSYQETPQTIEFGPLLDAGLFGIFGSVGSGKSSILEAISMALYGEIERLNKSGDERNYNMMNLKSDRLYLGFEFSNHAGRRFRFECEGKRNSKQYNKVYTYNRRAAEWNGDEWIALNHVDGETVTGISYNNFKRTVIIPQGRFQDFLELTPGGRSQMLQELFSLDKFDLTGPVNKLSSQNKEAVHRIEGQLTGYEGIDPEMLKTAQEHLKILSDLVKQKTLGFEKVKKRADDSSQLKELFDQQKSKQDALTKQRENETVIRAAELQLDQYQEARGNFEASLSQMNTIRQSVELLTKSRDKLVRQENTLQISKEQIDQKHDVLQKAIESHESERNKATSYTIAGKLLKARENLKLKEGRIEQGTQTVVDLRKKVAEKEKEVEKSEIKVAQDRDKTQDRELLVELKSVFKRRAELDDRIQKVTGKMEKEAQLLRDNKASFLKEHQLDSSNHVESEMAFHFESRLTECHAAIEDHRKKLHQLKVQGEMASYVEQLSSGESCPLCGSTEHPAPAHFEGTSLQIEQVNQQIKQLEVTQKKLEKGKFEWNTLGDNLRQSVQQRNQDQEELQTLNGHLHQADVFLKEHNKLYPGMEAVQRSLDASGKLMERIKKTEEEIKKTRQDIRKETGNLEIYRNKIAEIQSSCDQLRGEALSLEANLNDEIIGQLDQHTSTEWDQLSQQLNQKIEGEKSEYQQVSKERERITGEYIQLRTSIQETKNYLDKQNIELEKSDGKLEDMLKESSFESVNEIQELLNKELNVVLEQKRIRDHDMQMRILEEGLKDLERKIDGRSYDEDTHHQLIKMRDDAEKEIANLRDQKNYQTKKLEESKKRWDEKKKLKESLHDLQIRSDNLKILEGLFRGKKFVDYVSTVYLREICDIANRRFRELTNNHFSLVLGDENQFLVRDFLHDGQIRSVKTLSGGQTFQVSLCLALALAESLQNQSKSNQNFFFLDEGFGTLDGDALRLVMESLKSLRQEGRVVGVISHVESLQDEMDMYLHIRNDAEHGSQIQKSWEY